VPSVIENYIRSSVNCPVALIGCRASGKSHDCCEYDLALFTEESRQSEVLDIGGHAVELLYFSKQPRSYAVELQEMAIMRDDNRLSLASAAKGMTLQAGHKALVAAGRKSLVGSLFYQQKMTDAAENPAIAGMWAQFAAYQFLGGMLELSGARPMPLHELEQVRQADTSAGLADGIQAALECIGTERATRPAISRSIEATMELKSKDHDRDLVLSKVNHLLERQMLSDCYFYIGRMASENLARRSDSFYARYAKLIQLSMDLTNDVQELKKLQRRLFRAANAGLKV
jgi:hypothetical protein